MNKYHFVYKTVSESGKYYIGRHSTNDLNDGYLGSGKWIKASKKAGRHLNREILEFCDNPEVLLEKEEAHILEHFGKESCMNFLPNSSGFAAGEHHIFQLDPKAREKSRAKMWRAVEASRSPEVIKKRVAKTQGQKRSLESRHKMRIAQTGKKQSPETIEKRRLKLQGIRRSETTNAKMKLNFAKGINIPPSFKNKKHTEKTKEKMRLAALRRKRSSTQETRLS